MSATIPAAGSPLNLCAQLTPQSEIVCTFADIERVFSVWEQQFRDNPKGFNACATRLESEPPHVYGREAALFFVQLLEKEQPVDYVYNIASPAVRAAGPSIVATMA